MTIYDIIMNNLYLSIEDSLILWWLLNAFQFGFYYTIMLAGRGRFE